MNRRSTYYEDLEMEGPIEERFLPTRPSMYISSRDRHQETPQLVYKPEDYASSIFATLSSMREQHQLCDITIEVGEIVLHGHKAILAACSAYFHAMFSGDMKENNTGKVTIKGFSPPAIKKLIDFCYSSKIVIDLGNVLEILPAASLLQMMGVQEACCNFLASQLHPSNCLGIRKFADVHSCRDLWKKCNIFMQQRFPEVALHEEFLELDFKEIMVIVSDSHLNIRGEEQIYEAVIAWIKHDLENREKNIGELLSCVRMPLMSAAYLSREVKNEELVMMNFDGRGLVIEAMDFHLQKHYMRDKHTSKNTSIRTTPRQCPGLKYLFAIGGSGPPVLDDPYLDISECYDPERNEWRRVSPLTQRRCGLRIATCGGYLYAIGGFSATHTKALPYVDRYDPMTDSWRSVAPMSCPRRGFAVAVLDKYIYAIGGINGGTYYDSVERYCPKKNQWHFVQPMTVERRAVCAASLDNYIYAAGGHDGEGLLDTVERYDPSSDIWVVITNLRSPLCLGAFVSLKGYLYAVGGYDGANVLQCLQRFDPETEEWVNVAPLLIKRSGFGAAVMDGMLYLVGGCDSLTKVNSVDRYDPEKNQWTSVAKMSMRRSGVAVGVAPAFLF